MRCSGLNINCGVSQNLNWQTIARDLFHVGCSHPSDIIHMGTEVGYQVAL